MSNSALEGMNNRVKVVSHRAYSFPKGDTYITAIWHGSGDLPLEVSHFLDAGPIVFTDKLPGPNVTSVDRVLFAIALARW